MGFIALFGTIREFHYTIFIVPSEKKKKKFSFRKINGSQINSKCAFGSKLKNQLILLFSLFLLLFMDHTALFGTIYEFHYIISANFYFYLQYFQQFFFFFFVSAK